MKILILRVKAETEWIPIKTIHCSFLHWVGGWTQWTQKYLQFLRSNLIIEKKKEKGKGNHFSSQIIPQIRV